jgi:hypothetical protein
VSCYVISIQSIHKHQPQVGGERSI